MYFSQVVEACPLNLWFLSAKAVPWPLSTLAGGSGNRRNFVGLSPGVVQFLRLKCQKRLKFLRSLLPKGSFLSVPSLDFVDTNVYPSSPKGWSPLPFQNVFLPICLTSDMSGSFRLDIVLLHGTDFLDTSAQFVQCFPLLANNIR